MILYNLISIPLFVIFFFYFFIRVLQKKENFQERFKFSNIPFADNVIWLHAASLGEVKAVSALLEKIKEDNPARTIVISTITKAGQREAQRIVGPQYTFYYPFDFLPLLIPLFKRFKGGKLLLVETEIWPNLLFYGPRWGLQIYLINGRLSDRRYPRYHKFRFFFSRLLHKAKAIMAQSEEDHNKFASLGIKESHLHYTGNLKMDNLKLAQKGELAPDLSDYLSTIKGPLIVAGSTHKGEEEKLLNSFKYWQKEIPGLKMILAPRHLDRVDEVEGLAQNHNLAIGKRTNLGKDIQLDIMILNTLGELALLYPRATLVFVGGSLIPKGGHNPLEALGRPLYFGPFMENCREVANLLLKEQLAQEIKDEKELREKVLSFLQSDFKQLIDLSSKAEQFLHKYGGATDKTLDIILGK